MEAEIAQLKEDVAAEGEGVGSVEGGVGAG